MGWLSGWLYRKELTIDQTKVDDILTDFPVLVKLDEANFNFAHARSDGYDIRFTLDDGETLLKYEREFHGLVPNIDFCTGGVASASSEYAGYPASKAFDNDESTRWSSTSVAAPHWIKYDLGVGITKIINRITFLPFASGGSPIKNFKVQGSNNDSDWDDLLSTIAPNVTGWQSYSITNSTAYRYYRLWMTDTYRGDNWCSIFEIKMAEADVNAGYYWVKVPDVYSAVDTKIFVYYGKSDAVDGEDKTNVWDSNHKGIWHLKEIGTGVAGEYKDSTINVNDGQGLTAPTCVDDCIYRCQQFSASGKKINIPDAPSLELTNQNFTISMKVKFISFGSNWGLLGRYTSGSSYFYLGADFGVGTAIRFRDYGGSIDFSVNPSFVVGTWYDLEITRNGNNFKVWVNNIQVGSTYSSSSSLLDRLEGWQFGNVFGTNYIIDGYLDEIRFSIGIDRGSSWRKARIASDDLELLSFGSEELIPNFIDIDTDIRASKQVFADLDTDIRVKLEEHFKDIDIDLRISKQLIEDINTDIRIKLEEHFKDIDVDIRAVAQTLEDINTDIRVAEDVIKDIVTDFRVAQSVMKDIDTDLRVVVREFKDIATDIRVAHRISKNQIVVEELYFEEGRYLSSQAVTIRMKVYGALKMQFKNEIGGTWSALEDYSDTKIWTLEAGDGDKQVYVRFTDIQNVLSDGTDVIEAILNISTPTAVTVEAYTDETCVTPILDSTYQIDKTPFFRWQVPIFNIPYNGFSYALDGIPLDMGTIATPDMVRNGMVVSKKAPSSNMIFETTVGYYYFKSDLKEYQSQEVTLNAGDLSNDRIDIIYVSGTSESLNVAEGTPAPSPQEPEIPEDAIKLATILVPTGAIKSEDTTLTDSRQLYIELDKYLEEPLTLGQHTIKVKGICANGLISNIATFNIWVANDSPTIGEVKCYTDGTKLVELANGLYQTTDNTPYFEWDVAPTEPGPIRYYYTEDGTEPGIGDSFLVVNNYTPGVYLDGITILKVRAYDVTTGYWGPVKSFIFIYGTQIFTDDTAVICGNTILKQSLKEVHVKEISWDFNSARICRFFQPVAFDATLPFSEGNIVCVIYGSTNRTLFTGRIMQIERTIDIGKEGVMYHCSGPRQELAEEYAYITHEDYGDTAQITFEDMPVNTAIDTIVAKFPLIVKNIESYPSGATMSDEYIGQTVSNVLDSIYSKTKYGWYMRPNGSLVSIDMGTTNPGQAKFGIYGTTVNAISPQYNVMAANLQFDITNRYNKCVIEGAKKLERVTLKGKCIGISKSGEEIVDEGDRSDDILYKVFELDTKWPVVKVIETFITYGRLKKFILIPISDGVSISKFIIVFLETEICNYNNISRMVRNVKYTTKPSVSGTSSDGTPTEATTGTVSPGAMDSQLPGIGVPIIEEDTEIQGSLGPNNTVRFSRAMYNFWPIGESINSNQITVTPGININEQFGVPNYFWRNPPVKKCASLKADVLIETIPLKVEVTVPGTASGLSKTLRIVNTSFRFYNLRYYRFRLGFR